MLRILIVDRPTISYRPFRDQLQQEEMRVISIAGTTGEARLQLCHSDVVLVGSELPEAPALVQEITTEYPELKVLVAGIEEEARLILQFVEAGADGYLVREESAESMVQKVRAAVRGEALVSPRVAASLMFRMATLSRQRHAPVRHPFTRVEYEELTPRQSEVLELIREDLSNQQIADHLHIQVGTVKNHVHHILKKLDVHDRYEAAAAYDRWLQQESAREVYVML